MKKLIKWFSACYKIVPTYTTDNVINGYVPLKRSFGLDARMSMLQLGDDGKLHEVDAWFKNYKDALNFLKCDVKIFNNAEISDTKND